MSRNLSFLLVTSDEVTSSVILPLVQSEGHIVFTVVDLGEALSTLRGKALFDAVIFDIPTQPSRMLPLLKELVERVSATRVWLIAPMGISLWREEASRLGVSQVLWRPLQRHDLERLLDTVSDSDSLEPRSLVHPATQSYEARNGYLLEDLPNERYFLAACPAMLKLYENIRLLAAVDVPVLILGESGVGKDIVANLLHKHSLRAKAGYLSVNCAALPTELLESELFGYEAGAFTGAVKAKPGKFELADRGTLLLDEIGEMTAPMQAKLLHVLQDGRFSKLGARSESQVDVRIIAATNIDMDEAIASNSFRQDLYYRISAFTITVPPLRERLAEIPYLVEQMLKRHAAHFGQQPIEISDEVIELMQAYHWPGNLRELSNYVVRMQVLHSIDATVADLTTKIYGNEPRSQVCPQGPGEELHGVEDMRLIVRNFRAQTESRIIQETLDSTGWNRRHAASDLRISYRALLYKIQQYGLKNNRRPHVVRAASSSIRPLQSV